MHAEPNNSLQIFGLTPQDLQKLPIAMVEVATPSLRQVGYREYAFFINRVGASESSYLIDPKVANVRPGQKTAVFKVDEMSVKKLIADPSKIRPGQITEITVDENKASLIITYGQGVDTKSIEFRHLICRSTGLDFIEDWESCSRLITYLEKPIPGVSRAPLGGGSSFRVISGMEEEKRANVGASHQPGTPFQQDLNNSMGAEPKVQEKQHGSRTVN